MSKFEDKVAIVTGSATGIGYGISKRLSSENIKIIMVDYDGNMAEQSAGELIAKGGDVEVVIGDVSLPETAEEAVQAATSRWGHIDILVNNAGIGGTNGNIWELDVEELDRVYRTNLRGVFTFCNKTIPIMLENDYGRIVNIASIAG